MDVFVGILDSMFSFQVSEFVGFFCLKSQEFVFRENFVVLGGFLKVWWFRMIPTYAVVLEKTFGGIG